jgi:signal transduction histidine kinase
VRILVVDDDAEILRGTVRLLEKVGYPVDCAADGEAALQAVRARRPDLLLLDRNLPGIDGLEVCRRIKRDPTLRDVLVIMVSASHSQSVEQAEGLEAGADGYIARPVANRELVARVEAYVRIGRLARSLRRQAEELQESAAAARQAQAAALNLMEDAVEARDRLETRNRELRREVAEREKAEASLRASEKRLSALTNRLQTVREEEATRIAREIHDELGQQLTGLKMDLRWLERGLEELTDPGRQPLLEKTMAATELVDATVCTVQRIAAELRPAILDKLGLVAALRRETSVFQQKTGIACRLAVPVVERRLPPAVGIACFRIFQEAMTNVARHAAATVVEVELQEPPGGFVLEIRDNGRGIPAAVAAAGGGSLGLLGMRERAHARGGEVTVEPRPEGGTVVRLWIPGAEPEGKGMGAGD